VSELVHRALDFAAVAHREQLRKSPEAQIPYVAHCAGVAVTLARHGFGDDVVAAGALHDTLEDTETTAEELERRFGPRVRALVEACTEQDRALPWEERKARYIARLRTAEPEARAVSAADKLHNLESLLLTCRAGLDPFAQMKRGRAVQLDRFHRFLEALADGWQHPLVDEVRATLRALEQALPPQGPTAA
jgi:(p)ppGpp synthase/HD superfamily hydrolase